MQMNQYLKELTARWQLHPSPSFSQQRTKRSDQIWFASTMRKLPCSQHQQCHRRDKQRNVDLKASSRRRNAPQQHEFIWIAGACNSNKCGACTGNSFTKTPLMPR